MGPEHAVEILAQPVGSRAFSVQRPVIRNDIAGCGRRAGAEA
jgi:hypothetical protein